MKINRRVFLFSGLLSLSGLLYWKIPLLATNEVELFFSNYESIIPIEDALYADSQICLFEEKLLSMLTSLGVVKTISVVDQMIKDEYQLGRIQSMNGWIVSETESRVLTLRKKYV